MRKFIDDLLLHRHALQTLVRVNLKTTVNRSKLGWLWWIIDPLFMMGIYYFVIHLLFQRGGDNYHLFVLAGLIAWQFFTRSLMGTTTVILNNRQLIKQVALPITMLVAIPVIVQFIFAVIGVGVIIAWNFQATGGHTFAVLPLLLLIGSISFGLGLFLSLLNVYLDDINQLVSYTLRAGFFLSPILYPVSQVLDSPKISGIIKQLYYINPMAWIIPALRQVLLEGAMFSWLVYFAFFAIALLIIQTGLYCMRAQTARIIKVL